MKDEMMQDKIERVRAAVAATPKQKGVRYPASLRREMVEAAHAMKAAGKSWSSIAKIFGVGADTPRRMCEALPRGAGFVPVRVVPRQPLIATKDFSLVSPKGYRVEGLDLDQVVHLLTQLA